MSDGHTIVKALTDNVKDKIIGTLFGILVTLVTVGGFAWVHTSIEGHPVMVERVGNLEDVVLPQIQADLRELDRKMDLVLTAIARIEQ